MALRQYDRIDSLEQEVRSLRRQNNELQEKLNQLRLTDVTNLLADVRQAVATSQRSRSLLTSLEHKYYRVWKAFAEIDPQEVTPPFTDEEARRLEIADRIRQSNPATLSSVADRKRPAKADSLAKQILKNLRTSKPNQPKKQ